VAANAAIGHGAEPERAGQIAAMSEIRPKRLSTLSHALVLALALAGAWAWASADYCGPPAYPLWIPALAVWLGASAFWLGFVSDDLKLLFLLAAGWVGVAASLAVFAIFIGGGVAASGETTAIRIAVAGVLLLPVLLLPRLKLLWPGMSAPSSAAVHAARSLFVLLQYGGIALLVASLIRFCPETPAG
jgi:hypothetical protein